VGTRRWGVMGYTARLAGELSVPRAALGFCTAWQQVGDRALESGCGKSVFAPCLGFPAYKMEKGQESKQVLIIAQRKVLAQ